MQMIILCGGLGTRLREVIGESQKTMADVKGSPFLKNIIDFYKSQNITDYILACGYKSEEVIDYFKNGDDFGVHIDYAVEKTPLGTGGAIRNCLSKIKNDFVMVINGDTLLNDKIDNLYNIFKNTDSDMSIMVKKINDAARYGTITLEADNNLYIKKFDEKIENDEEVIVNAGVYIIKKSLIEKIPDKKNSLETELIPDWLDNGVKISVCFTEENFIDIGTKESLHYIRNN